jgi:ATP-dependent RNA helicase DeaD
MNIIAALLRHQFQDEFLEASYAKIEQSRATADNVKLFVALGKKDGMNPRALLDVLHQSCKTPGRKVRDIRIMEKFSFISVPLDEAEIIMRKLNQKNKKMVEVAKN